MSMQSQTGITKYGANVTQASTAAPVHTVTEKDFLQTFTHARTSAGFYTLTANYAAFTANKTRVKFGAVKGLVEVTSISTTVITYKTYDDAGSIADGVLLNTAMDIEVSN